MEVLLLSSAFSLSASKFWTDSTQTHLRVALGSEFICRIPISMFSLGALSVHGPAEMLSLNNLTAAYKLTNATVKHIYSAGKKTSSLLYKSIAKIDGFSGNLTGV
jgi:hypothetical protein